MKTKLEMYNELTEEQKLELKRWLESFDEIFLHIENGVKSFATDVIITTSYAPDEKDILFKKVEVESWGV